MVKRYTLKDAVNALYIETFPDNQKAFFTDSLSIGTRVVLESDYTELELYIKELQRALNHMTNLWMQEKEKANG